ncbi:MAG: FtsH protease activity modulator HflK [Caulobacter sp.]|nr:FtsH protease activity modulator HflK [Caulobacter sp.]
MPWNDNANPGPWGSPPPEGEKPKGSSDEPRRPQRPQGGGPRRPPPEGVDLNELIERYVAQLRGLLGGGNGGGGGSPDPSSLVRYLPMAAGLVVFLVLLSGIVIVGQRERAVITTFGAWTRTYGPGIGYRLPLVEGVKKVNISSLRKTEVGGSTNAPTLKESLMLTGDQNVVDLRFTVNWRVSDPGKFLFNISGQETTVKAVAESAMREVVGRSDLDPILSTGKAQVQDQTVELMQRVLDSYDAGIIIDSIQIEDAQPPKEVVAAFQDVATAGQNKEAKINKARGEAAGIQQKALGYKAQVVNEARGEAQRFNQVYEQYKLAPAVTRQRLYIETMEKVLSKSNKVIIDGKGVTAPIVLSPDAFRRKDGTSSLSVTPQTQQGAGQ